jgi:hypothetical protein
MQIPDWADRPHAARIIPFYRNALRDYLLAKLRKTGETPQWSLL